MFKDLALGVALSLACSPSADAASDTGGPRAKLKGYVAEIQRNPDDHELRQKIISLALALKPAPAVPPEAKRHLNRGRAAFEAAKTATDIGDAVSEFHQAALAAPWWGSAYYNLGLAKEKAGEYAAAKRDLKLYLLAVPGARDAEAVQGLIDGIEYRLEKAARTPASPARPTPSTMSDEDLIRYLNGARYRVDLEGGSFMSLDITDGYAIFGYAAGGPWEESSRVAIRSRTFILGSTLCDLKHSRSCPRQWTISQDGSNVTERSAFGNGKWSDTILNRSQ